MTLTDNALKYDGMNGSAIILLAPCALLAGAALIQVSVDRAIRVQTGRATRLCIMNVLIVVKEFTLNRCPLQ